MHRFTPGQRAIAYPRRRKKAGFIAKAWGHQAAANPNEGYMNRGGGLTGAADSKIFLRSIWVKHLAGNGATRQFFEARTTAERMRFLRASSNRYESSGWNAAGTQIMRNDSNSTFTAASGWHHILHGVDLGAGYNRLVINGAVDEATTPLTTDDLIDFTVTDWFIGGRAFVQIGDLELSNLYLTIGETLDVTDPDVVAKFRNPTTGKPVSLGANGELPTGNQPILFLDGDHTNAHINKGSGGDFSQHGVGLIAATSSPSD